MGQQRTNWSEAFSSRQEQRQQKRMAVIHTGARLFNERGYDRTTLDDIASQPNVSKRTLYYYVKNKEEILFECNRLGLEFMRQVVTDSMNTNRPPLDRINALISRYVGLLAEDLGACVVLSRDATISAANKKVLRDARRDIDGVMRALIQSGVDDDSIAPCNPTLAAAAIFGALNWLPHWARESKHLAHDEIANEYAKILVEGLRTR